MMVLADLIGNLMGMDLIQVIPGTDKVTYVYRTDGVIASERIQKLKATIMSVFNLPADIPINIQVEPVKRGLLVKGFIVKVDVKSRPFKLRGR